MAVLFKSTLLGTLCRRAPAGFLPMAHYGGAVRVGNRHGETVLQAVRTIGGDLLPVVLQVAAVAVALRRGDGASLRFAGALAGLAITSKLTAIWALLAVPTWLAAHRRVACRGDLRRRGYSDRGCCSGRGGGHYERRIVEALTVVLNRWRGRYPFALARSRNQLLYNLRGYASGAVVLLPLAGTERPAVQRRAPSVAHRLRARVCVPVDPRDLFRPGHRLEPVSGFLVVLTALAVGHLAGRGNSSTTSSTEGAPLRAAIALTVIGQRASTWCERWYWTRGARVPLSLPARALGAPRSRSPGWCDQEKSCCRRIHRFRWRRVGGRFRRSWTPFMLTRLDGPSDTSGVGRPAHRPNHGAPVRPRCPHRIPDDPSVDYWWTDYHLGPRIAKALRQSYKFDRMVGRFYLYRPAP